MNVMNITQILQSVNNMSAGPTYSVGSIAEELSKTGHDVTVMSFGVPPQKWSFRVELDNTYNKAESFGLLGVESIIKIRNVGLNSDILHCHGVWRSSNLFSYFIKSNSKSKIVWSPRGMFSDWSWNHHSWMKKPFWALLQKNAIQKTHCFHATAESEYIDIRKRNLKQPVAIIPNGVPIPKLGGIQKTKEIVFLSRIHKKKGIELLINAWVDLQKIHSDWSVKVAGPLDSAYANEIQEYAKSRNVTNFEFVGELLGDEKKQFLSRASLFVLPSYSENFGIAIAESLAHGTPVITTTETPWSGMRDKNCGWWVEPDLSQIKEAMSEALNTDFNELAVMGEAGRKWMMQDFSWQAISEMMEELYNWLVDNGVKPSFVIED